MTELSTKPTTFLHQPLTSNQHASLNYLTPIIITLLVYMLHFAADGCLAIQHVRDENPIFASITFLLMYTPVLGALLFTLSNVEQWPNETGCGKENIKWFLVKLVQHINFPIWAMYRFAEQLFWSIEAIRSIDEKEINDCLIRAERNSVFDLYYFLQAYLQAAPQILFQMHIIFKQNSNFNQNTVNMQVFSIIMSLIKMAMTTTSYQRFKSQKPTGRQYPWKKVPKPVHLNTIQEKYVSLIPQTEQEGQQHLQQNNEELNTCKQENSDPEVDQEDDEKLSRKVSGLSVTSSQFNTKVQESSADQPDFVLPVKIIFYRGLPEDDAAGKLVSFFWWFCFILPRMLSLSAFAYFYKTEIWWLCSSHYIICLGFLLYDAHTSDIPYYRAVFILFTAYVYMFCLIEFKIKFKKVKFIYTGYFTLVFLENFIITSIWYHGEEFIYSDWWYRYIFYLVTGSSIISAISMFFYIFILKPSKLTLNQGYRSSKIL